MSPNMANSAVYPLGVDKWVVSWTQTFAVHIRVVAPPGEWLRVKADMVLLAGNTVWSILSAIEAFAKTAVRINVTFSFTHSGQPPPQLPPFVYNIPPAHNLNFAIQPWVWLFDNPQQMFYTLGTENNWISYKSSNITKHNTE